MNADRPSLFLSHLNSQLVLPLNQEDALVTTRQPMARFTTPREANRQEPQAHNSAAAFGAPRGDLALWGLVCLLSFSGFHLGQALAHPTTASIPRDSSLDNTLVPK